MYEINSIEFNNDDVTYVIDGGFLLHRVVWQKDLTFGAIIDQYINYLLNHYGHNIVVVFDGYNDNSKNIKAMEQLRRMKTTQKSIDMLFEETTAVSCNQEQFFSNRSTTDRFIRMLMTTLKVSNIDTRQAQDDADVMIVDTALEKSTERTTVIVGEDIDLFILLIGRTPIDNSIYFLKPGKGNVVSKIYNPCVIGKYASCIDNI